jgi:hypothetical protein
MKINELVLKKEKNPLSIEFIKENEALLKELEIKKDYNALLEQLNKTVPKISSFMSYLNTTDNETDNLLLAITKHGASQDLLNKLKAKNKNVYEVFTFLYENKKETDFYIKTNFSSQIIREITKTEVKSLFDLINAIVELKKDKKVVALMNSIKDIESLKTFIPILKNSDQITQHIFIKYLLPNLISAGLSHKEVQDIIDIIKMLASSTTNHRDFYAVLNNASLFLYLFGYNDLIVDYLRCV